METAAWITALVALIGVLVSLPLSIWNFLQHQVLLPKLTLIIGDTFWFAYGAGKTYVQLTNVILNRRTQDAAIYQVRLSATDAHGNSRTTSWGAFMRIHAGGNGQQLRYVMDSAPAAFLVPGHTSVQKDVEFIFPDDLVFGQEIRFELEVEIYAAAGKPLKRLLLNWTVSLESQDYQALSNKRAARDGSYLEIRRPPGSTRLLAAHD